MDLRPNIAIISTNKNKYSETFIHQHVKYLPANIHYLFDGYLPKQCTTKGINGKSTSFLQKKWWYRQGKRNSNSKQLANAVTKYLQKNNIKAVLAEYGPSGVAVMNICQQLNIPLIVHFHGYDAYRNDMMQSHGVHYPTMFQIASAVIGVSQHMLQRLKTLGCPVSKLHYIPYGFNTDFFTEHNTNTRKANLCLAVGRFADTKAPHLSILAFKQVVAQIPTAQLMMVGNGYLLNACKTLVKSLSIEKNVHFLGSVAHEKVAKYMQQASVFIQHSVTTPENDTEGTPVSIVEACASKLAIVSTIHAGIPDVISHGESGFLVKEGDIDGMAKYIVQLLQHEALRKKMGDSAYHTVKQKYNQNLNISQLWQVIENATRK